MTLENLETDGGSTALDEERQTLLNQRELILARLRKAAERYDNSIGGQLGWRRTLESFRKRVERLNEGIEEYNRLNAPSGKPAIPSLDAEHEIANAR